MLGRRLCCLYLQVRITTAEQHTFRAVFYGKDQGSVIPYTCYGLRALLNGRSATVPWSCLFFLHVHGLHARCYGLWAIQGRELRAELIARSSLIVPLSPSYFNNCRAAHVPRCSLWRRPSLRSLPTCATGSTLCVMGGRLRFLGHAYSSYTCTGSALDVMDYGLAKAMRVRSEQTAWTLLVMALWLKLRRFLRQNASK